MTPTTKNKTSIHAAHILIGKTQQIGILQNSFCQQNSLLLGICPQLKSLSGNGIQSDFKFSHVVFLLSFLLFLFTPGDGNSHVRTQEIVVILSRGWKTCLNSKILWQNSH